MCSSDLVLAHTGLGMLDETEVESIPEARRSSVDIEPPPPLKVQEVKPVDQGKYPLMFPGASEPHSYAHTGDGWVTSMSLVIDKIVTSSKFTPEEKMEKFRSLLNANSAISNALEGPDFEAYEGIIKRVQAGLSRIINAKEKQDGV